MSNDYEMPGEEGLGIGRTLKPSKTKVGKALRAERIRRGWDQTYVASSIGIAQSKLSRYEIGETKYPPPDRLVALARLYDKPDDHFLEMVGYRNGAKLVAQVPPEGSLVIERPRAGLVELMDIIEDMTDPEFAELINDAEFIVAHRGQDDDARTETPKSHQATA